ncbi:Ig-like domain-containing protein [Actinoplanes sp. Pm04-4]|uniref:Ig-like domain-containing protein n=1 Tax=Paractinoplanes pyxinae TaxID=2997416 RepID=A0ABT4BDK3_9ACTN|nr:Ig-like domain-containing protein [Actinoplanes pyxinae]MCY1144596.1 Ig-like domain-containing protein [Actinoplanes pyxinae]
MKTWGIKKAAVVLAAASVLLASGCGDGDKKSSWQGGGQPGSSASPNGEQPASPEPLPSTVAVSSPAAEAKNVQAIAPIKFESENPDDTTVKVTDAKGDEVEGTLDKDAKTFTPSKALPWGTKFTVTVTGPEADGKNNTATSTFTTMAKPAKLIRVSSFLGDGQQVGVGMPLIIRFGRAIPESFRDDVERRMKVTATPAQEGTWHWTSPTEVHYRTKVYWKANSKVFYKVSLAGVPLGNGYYGRSDLTVDLKIGREFIMNVSNKSKQMTVKQNGKIIKTIPVSLGKKSTPSSSGTMVVIEKKKHTIFDTTDELPAGEGYKTPIDFAQRITWSGQFIHAAPWSEGKQGKVNVSHGCVNVSEKMGAWLFDRTLMGDPITVSGTEEKLKNGNGWTDWNMSWEEYKKGSYL